MTESSTRFGRKADARTEGSGAPRELVAAFKSQRRETALQKTGDSHVPMANSTINSIFGPPEDAGVKASQTGTSIFDPVLCELVYRWFCPPGGAILDPFAGGSVRGIVAARLGYQYTGIDLRPEQVAANEAQAAELSPDNQPRWVVGDSRDSASLAPGAYDLLFTCPPYVDLERYSDDPADLSTMSYPAFCDAYTQIIQQGASLLRPDRFACFVVGDVRDRDGYYYGLPSFTIAAFTQAGLRLYNEAVLVTAIGSLPLRVSGTFQTNRKLGKTHQNVLIFCKGDWRTAVEDCGPVDMAESEAPMAGLLGTESSL